MDAPNDWRRARACLLAGVIGLLASHRGEADNGLAVPPQATTHRADPDLHPADLWSLRGAVEVSSIIERYFGLTADEPDVWVLESSLELELAFTPPAWPHIYGEIRLSHDRFMGGEVHASGPESKFELRQAFIAVPTPVSGLELQVGRQRFEDPRGWWIDESLDAVRLTLDLDNMALELDGGRSEVKDRDLLGRERSSGGDILMAVGRYQLHEDAELAAYVVAQDDRSPAREKPVFIGLQASGQTARGIAHWIDAALVRGTDDGRPIRAFGLDLGLEIPLPAPREPVVLLGFSFGSGDDDPMDGADREFRQTGLHSSYFYYGEVMAPELSNLWVLTAGFGMEPVDVALVRILFHAYRQHYAAAVLRDSLLDRDPDGRDRDLGVGVDFVGSLQIGDRAFLDLVLGAYEPGRAFGPDAEPAYFGQLVFTYDFW